MRRGDPPVRFHTGEEPRPATLTLAAATTALPPIDRDGDCGIAPTLAVARAQPEVI